MPAAFDLFDLKGMLKTALRKELAFKRVQSTSFAPLVCDLVDAEGHLVGKVGQVRPGLAKEIGARSPVLVAELI